MSRQSSRRVACAALVVAIAAVLPACGIKGPLRPAPKSAPAAAPPPAIDNPAIPPATTSPALPPPAAIPERRP